MNWNILEKSVSMLLLVTSPEFRKMLVELVKDLYIKASNTDNPFDDWFVEFFARLLAIDVDKVLKVKE